MRHSSILDKTDSSNMMLKTLVSPYFVFHAYESGGRPSLKGRSPLQNQSDTAISLMIELTSRFKLLFIVL